MTINTTWRVTATAMWWQCTIDV